MGLRCYVDVQVPDVMLVPALLHYDELIGTGLVRVPSLKAGGRRGMAKK